MQEFSDNRKVHHSIDEVAEDVNKLQKISVKTFIWEYNQNDPKRDSGSKLYRLKMTHHLKIGEVFKGIVLSSKAKTIISPLDTDIIKSHGIAGINCSWNRLEEIPFDKMGKKRCHRYLPFLYAANTINYGRPYKLNTAEAIAACLYITGYKDDARLMLSPFAYGDEFFKLNLEALELYSNCSCLEEVVHYHSEYENLVQEKLKMKEKRKTEEAAVNQSIVGQYLDDCDLPPIHSDEYEPLGRNYSDHDDNNDDLK